MHFLQTTFQWYVHGWVLYPLNTWYILCINMFSGILVVFFSAFPHLCTALWFIPDTISSPEARHLNGAFAILKMKIILVLWNADYSTWTFITFILKRFLLAICLPISLESYLLHPSPPKILNITIINNPPFLVDTFRLDFKRIATLIV